MITSRAVLIGFLLLIPAFASANAGYGYPLDDSYAATILGTPQSLRPNFPGKTPVKTMVLETDMKKPGIFFYDRGLRYTVAFQDRKAPLIFLIAGTGGSSRSPKMLALMENLHHSGFHVIGLPSPTFPNFIINGSTSHVPGNLSEDAVDLYRIMEKIWSQAKGSIEVSDFLLAGYSLGGTEAAFVAKLDEEAKVFAFSTVLMINPAVSLYKSVSKIEGLLDGIPGGPRRVGAFFNSVMAKGGNFYHKGDFVTVDDDFLFAAYQDNLLGRSEAGGVIAVSFRISSAGMIFASDVMTNNGYVVPKNKVLENSDSLEDYFWTSRQSRIPREHNLSGRFPPHIYMVAKEPGMNHNVFHNLIPQGHKFRTSRRAAQLSFITHVLALVLSGLVFSGCAAKVAHIPSEIPPRHTVS
jgi:hypothetical protein